MPKKQHKHTFKNVQGTFTPVTTLVNMAASQAADNKLAATEAKPDQIGLVKFRGRQFVVKVWEDKTQDQQGHYGNLVSWTADNGESLWFSVFGKVWFLCGSYAAGVYDSRTTFTVERNDKVSTWYAHRANASQGQEWANMNHALSRVTLGDGKTTVITNRKVTAEVEGVDTTAYTPDATL